MQKIPINNFTVIESIYGKFIVNRHCQFHAEFLIKSGMPHIQPELEGMLGIINTLPAGSVAVDAGANIGLVSIPLAQALKERGGTVHAFEVQRMLSYALAGSATLNDLENLHVHNKGLGAKKGFIPAVAADYGAAQDLGSYSLVRPRDQIKHQQNQQQEQVEILTIDELGLPRLDFLKIDVEGMEIDVLTGARKTLEVNRPWGWIEYWMVKVEDIKAQFAGLPYKFFMLNDRDMLCAPIERMEAGQIAVSAQEI